MSEPATAADLRRGFLAQLDGDNAAAEAHFRRALTLPHLAPLAREHLIQALRARQDWQGALKEIRAAFAESPDAEHEARLALNLLAAGEYAEAWPHFEARARTAAGYLRPDLPYPEWDGRPVRSLTVWDEQGYGDAIQFARFLPVLRDRGVEVSLICRPELSTILAPLVAKVIPAEGKLRIPVVDAWAMVCSLAGRLGITLDDLPVATAYLEAPAAHRERWRGQLTPYQRIGVVARGKAIHANDLHRSLPPAGAAFLKSLPGAMSLTPEDDSRLTDFADTAAVIEQLDLVISVDTAVAHLAGAMGKPCWILLPHIGEDWRWLHGRNDSPWYPSVKLYRQPAPGDWGSVLRAVAADLPGFFGQAAG